MRVLLGCVNSTHSLVGYDFDEGKAFWACPQSLIRSCGICYDGDDLLLAGDNHVIRLSAENAEETTIFGRFDALAHSVHPVTGGLFGVVDTGNSRVVVYSSDGSVDDVYCPLAAWEASPHDAIHLNDFAETPHGMIASCFDYRPWRSVREKTSWGDWCTGGYGLILRLDGAPGSGAGRVVGSGFNHPHSLTWHENRLHLCSSSTGEFHVCEMDAHGLIRELDRFQISKDHFVRGILPVEGNWLIGGSSTRHGEQLSRTLELYRLDPASGSIENRVVGGAGEIYDVLPWHDDVLMPLIERHLPQTLTSVPA